MEVWMCWRLLSDSAYTMTRAFRTTKSALVDVLMAPSIPEHSRRLPVRSKVEVGSTLEALGEEGEEQQNTVHPTG